MPKQMRRVTIKDVAEKANVAIGTVSRYLNNNGYVSGDAMERIQRAIKELDFIPSAAARSMINKKSAIIGVTVPEINNPYLADLVVRIEASLSQMNYSIMLCNTQYKSEKVAAFIDDLIMRNAEGLFLVATDVNDEAMVKRLSNYLYTVSIGHKLDGFDCIRLTDYESAYELTRHLIDMNHRKIGFIGFNENAHQTVSRVEGYCGALRDAGLAPRDEFILQSYAGHRDGYRLAKQLLSLEDKPTAMIAINDFYAMNAYSAISDAGLEVGRDISVAGFDDIFMARFLSPALTTVRCDSDAVVENAIGMLREHLDGKTQSVPRDIELEATVIYRQSICRIG
jgi:DNA-binding LacI/PurR family transcriptional regulator